MENKIFIQIIKELCNEMNIYIDILSYDWILKLSKNNKTKYIVANKFDLNTEAIGNIACDKYATFEVLKSNNVPVVEHYMLFNPQNRSAYTNDTFLFDLLAYFNKNEQTVVVKPNNGYHGKNVYLCKNQKELFASIYKLFIDNDSISICPYYNIHTEYRVFYLDGSCVLIYGKKKPYIVGNGKNDIITLISKLNLPDNNIVKENLSNLDLNYIPNNNEIVELSWKHNLSGGATPFIIKDDELKSRIVQLASLVGKTTNIRFATVDIIHTTNNNLYVLEINSGISSTKFIDNIENGYELAKDIYKKALEKMF